MVYVIPLERHLTYCRWPGCRVEPIDTQLPLCERHFTYIGERFMDERSVLGSKYVRAAQPALEERREAVRERAQRVADTQADRSVVYYVRIGDHVKIGYTCRLPQRLSALRVDRDALLAVEPGSRDEEAKRHEQFTAERQGRRENFNPSRRLLAHVDVVRSRFGEPWAYAERRASEGWPLPQSG